MMGLPNLASDTSDVYSVVSPSVSTKVDGHPLLNVSAVHFECGLSNYDLLVLSQPYLDQDHYIKIVNNTIQSTFNNRTVVNSMGCLHFCSTSPKELLYDVCTAYDMSLLSMGAAKKSGYVQFVSLHGSNVPNNHFYFYEGSETSMLFDLLKDDPIAASTLVELLFNSIRTSTNKKVLLEQEIEAELYKLEKESGTFNSSTLSFTRSDLLKLSTSGYVGLSELGTVLPIGHLRISSKQADHQISTYLIAKFGVTFG